MTSANPATTPHLYFAVSLDTTAVADLPTTSNYLGLFRSAANSPTYIYFVGCDVILGDTFYLFNMLGPAEVKLDNLVVDSRGGTKLMNLHTEASTVLRLSGQFISDVPASSAPDGQEPLTSRAATQVSEFSSLINGYSAERTVRYNLQTNVDLG